jgi:Leucine-rich repeat (LRR) protein
MYELDSNSILQIRTLDISDKNIQEIPYLLHYKNLRRFVCKNNKIKKLPEFPKKLKYIDIRNNELEELPEIPNSVIYLDVRNNHLKILPKFSSNMKILLASNNELNFLPLLFKSKLTRIDCRNNHINFIPYLPPNLKVFYGSGNPYILKPNFINITYNDIYDDYNNLFCVSSKIPYFGGYR